MSASTTHTTAFFRRVRRHVIGRRREYFVVTAPGFERLTLDELTSLPLSADSFTAAPGGIAFNGKLEDCHLANLHLRTAGRIFMRVAEFKATNFRELAKKAAEIPWEIFIASSGKADVRVSASRSRLYHTTAIAERFQESLQERSAGALLFNGESARTTQRIHVRTVNDRFTVSVDSSGENLYKRGLKTHSASAPLRETTAAAILRLAGYLPGEPLIDPMCGSGTFSLEAAMMTAGVPAGYFRKFSFMDWPSFQEKRWAHLKAASWKPPKTTPSNRLNLPDQLIMASDTDAGCCEALKKCVKINRNFLGNMVSVEHRDFFDISPAEISEKPGLVALNPPYGKRLDAGEGTLFFKKIGDQLKRAYKGWKVAVIVPEKALAAVMPGSLKPHSLTNGGIRVTLLTGRIP